MRPSPGRYQTDRPALWQLAAFSAAAGVVFGVPPAILMSRRARLQFGTPAGV